jgi:hypothetical protein
LIDLSRHAIRSHKVGMFELVGAYTHIDLPVLFLGYSMTSVHSGKNWPKTQGTKGCAALLSTFSV